MVPTQEIQPPNWLNQEFLETSLREGLNDPLLKIKELSIKPAVAAGDNYASHIFRTILTTIQHGATQQLHFIIKSLPPGDKMLDAIRDMNIFIREARMLKEVVPKMHQLLLDAGVQCSDKFAAKCFYSQGAPRDLLILEDLCESGYKLANRQNGLDLEHTLLVIKSLASYHAGMYALLQKEPQYKTAFGDSFWHESYNEKTTKAFEGPVHCMAELVTQWADYPQHFAEKLYKLERTIQMKTNDMWKVDESFKFNTIIHGDCWLTNMMFRYDRDGKVDGHVFVDFQMPAYGSPLLDLVYFLFTSVRHDVRKQHLDTFVQVYHHHLSATLKQLGQNIDLSLDDIKNEFQNKLFFGFVSALFVLPMVISPPGEGMDLENILDTESEYNNQHLYKNKQFQEIIKELLPFFDQQKVLG